MPSDLELKVAATILCDAAKTISDVVYSVIGPGWDLIQEDIESAQQALGIIQNKLIEYRKHKGK